MIKLLDLRGFNSVERSFQKGYTQPIHLRRSSTLYHIALNMLKYASVFIFERVGANLFILYRSQYERVNMPHVGGVIAPQSPTRDMRWSHMYSLYIYYANKDLFKWKWNLYIIYVHTYYPRLHFCLNKWYDIFFETSFVLHLSHLPRIIETIPNPSECSQMKKSKLMPLLPIHTPSS